MADEARVALEAHKLRGIAHPVRVRLLGELRADGPATASGLAGRLGLNTGATSYHLRQLAAHGFVEEDTERGTARERWWRSVHFSMNWDSETLADEEGFGTAFLRSTVEVYSAAMLQAVDELPALPEAWRGAGGFNDHLLLLSPAELAELTAELGAVVARYRTGDPEAQVGDVPEDAAQVVVQFQTFPRPGRLGAYESEDGTGS